jgi:hypothetical protein
MIVCPIKSVWDPQKIRSTDDNFSSVSPCVLFVDDATVTTIVGLVASISRVQRLLPAAVSEPGSRQPITTGTASTLAAAGDQQGFDVSAELSSLSVFVNGVKRSCFSLQGVAVARTSSRFSGTLRQLRWDFADEGPAFFESDPSSPFVHVVAHAASSGGNVSASIASLSGCVPNDVLRGVLGLVRSWSVGGVAASEDSSSRGGGGSSSMTDSAPPLTAAAAHLLAYQQLKLLVAPWSLGVSMNHMGTAVLRLSFDHVFLAMRWAADEEDNPADSGKDSAVGVFGKRHVGSATAVGLRVTSSNAQNDILEPLTVMAELSLSQSFADIVASVTHAVRIYIRPVDAMMILALLEETAGTGARHAAPPSSAGMVASTALLEETMGTSMRPAQAPPYTAPASSPEAPSLQLVQDVTSLLVLSSSDRSDDNALGDERHPYPGECLLGMAKTESGAPASTVTWRLHTTQAVLRVYQRHAIAAQPRSAPVVVQVQYWDIHGKRYVTAGTLLLSSQEDPASLGGGVGAVDFPVKAPATRVAEWRLCCRALASPQQLHSALGVDVAVFRGDLSWSLSVPKTCVYFTHAYQREADGKREEEEVLVYSVSGLHLADTSGDGRFSLHARSSLKCVQFDDLSLVDLVEPFSVTAVRLGSAWDVRSTRVSLNVSPSLCGTVARFCSLWNVDALATNEFEFAYYVLHNVCCVPLMVGQESTGEELTLAPQAKQKYSWQSGLAPKKALQLWLPSSPTGTRVSLEMDAWLKSQDQHELEMTVDLDGFLMYIRVERAADAPGGAQQRVITFLGSFIIHSLLTFDLAFEWNGQVHMARSNQSVGILVAAPRAVRFTKDDLVYPVSFDIGKDVSARTLMEIPSGRIDAPRFWACQIGTRLSLIPLLTVWNCLPCSVHFRVLPSLSQLATFVILSGGSLTLDHLLLDDLSHSTLQFALAPSLPGAEFSLTLNVLKSAAEVPQSTQLKCGRHYMYLSIFAERFFGGVVAVLHARFVARNETSVDLEAFAGTTPKYPEDRVVVMPTLEPVRVVLPALSFTLMPWEAHQADVSFRVRGCESNDDWRDLNAADDSEAGAEGRSITVRCKRFGELTMTDAQDVYFRHPLAVAFERHDIPVPSTKAHISSTTMTVDAQMMIHSKLDVDIFVRIGCGLEAHIRCLTGPEFCLAAHSSHELLGFGFGFHISISLDGRRTWSDALQV